MLKEKLKAARKKKGLTQVECAVLADLRFARYSDYERGLKEPPQEIIFKLESVLEIEPGWLTSIE